MRRLRVGVVGCGEIAQIMHLPFLHELEQFEIAAICDLSPGVLRAVGEALNIPDRYESHREMLAAVDVDIVAVLTMDHTEVAIDAARAGAHIFIEKPLAFSIEHGEAICQAAEENDVQLMVGYMKLYDEGYLHAVELFHQMRDVRFIRVQDFTGRWDRHRSLYTLVSATDIPDEQRRVHDDRLASLVHEALGSDDPRLTKLYRMLLMLGSHDLAVLRGVFGVPTSVISVHAPTSDLLTATLAYDDGKTFSFEAGERGSSIPVFRRRSSPMAATRSSPVSSQTRMSAISQLRSRSHLTGATSRSRCAGRRRTKKHSETSGCISTKPLSRDNRCAAAAAKRSRTSGWPERSSGNSNRGR